MSDDNTSDAAAYTPKEPRFVTVRERLAKLGPKALSATDLLCLVSGSPRAAKTLVRRHGLEGLVRLSAEGWRKERGIGEAAAARLTAVFELGRRAYGAHNGERPTISRPNQAFQQVRHLAGLKKEHLVGLYLDAQNGLLHKETISMGALNTTRTHPREILHPAVVHLALGFILVHNHPSGCLDPSPEDLEFTRAVGRAGELMGIELYDHLIVASSGFTSMRERGLL